MKVAPILHALKARGHHPVLVHTGQHYDKEMSDAFFDDLQIPTPDHYLNVGSGSHATQTARVMERFEPVLLEVDPDWVVVVGDVNSTLACALVTSKLRDTIGCRLAHVEAGLRSGDWRMPEEVNRVLTDRLADLLLTPSVDAESNLLQEGMPKSAIRFVGNVMIDTLIARLPEAISAAIPERMGLERRAYTVVTLHRPSNVDNVDALAPLLGGLAMIAQTTPVLFPLHPRVQTRITAFGLESHLANIRVMKPLGYRDMLSIISGAAVVLTDSGGLQEETTALGVECVTLREQTERPITIIEGTNRLIAWPPTSEGIVAAHQDAALCSRAISRVPLGWDGRAADRVVTALEEAGAAAIPMPARPLSLTA
jgi:UDP-N-acetylglucosamine 2-epimerase (non-hydrolysing)